MRLSRPAAAGEISSRHGRPSPSSSSRSAAFWRALPPSLREAWAPHLGDESFAPLGNRFPRPGIAHRYAPTVAMAQSGSPLHERMMMGIQGQHRPIVPEPRPRLLSIIQLRPLVQGACSRGKPRRSGPRRGGRG